MIIDGLFLDLPRVSPVHYSQLSQSSAGINETKISSSNIYLAKLTYTTRLGCVLLEIGLWKSLYHIHDEHTRTTGSNSYIGFKEYLLAKQPQLLFHAGSTYASAVKSCLEVSHADSEQADEVAHDILLDVIRKLESCAA